LRSNVSPKFGEKAASIKFRPHGSLIQNTTVEIADTVNSLVDANADTHNVGFFSVDMKVRRRTATARLGHFSFVNDGGAEQTINDNRNRAGPQASRLDKIYA
jgi:hypothetical protein